MNLLIFSIFDVVSNQSIFITMHNTVSEAEREFKRCISQPSISHKKNDLKLVAIGQFNTVTLEIVPIETISDVLCGADVYLEVSE